MSSASTRLTKTTTSPILQLVCRLVEDQRVKQLTDQELLGRFRSKRDEAAFHVLLCLAFEQEAKNAWEAEDYATIEDALRKALGQACTALRLDPRPPCESAPGVRWRRDCFHRVRLCTAGPALATARQRG